MNKIVKIFLGILFSFSSCLIGIGYANVSSDLRFTGDVKAKVQENVFISNVVAGSNNVIINGYVSTTLNSTVTLTNSNNASETMTITVYNNSNVVYGFNAVKYMIDETSSAYDNENIQYNLLDLERRQAVQPKSYLTFNVSFTYVDSKASSNKTLNSILNYEFLPLDLIPEDEEEIAVNGVLERFEQILNTPLDSKRLTDQMDDYSNNDRYDDSYTGNVVGASPEDVALLNELFVGNLTMNINGKVENVTILIKREDVDGKSTTGDAEGNEMTVYMTTDPLSRRYGSAIVYAGVYTKKTSNSSWSIIGSMYEGECDIKSYSGLPWGTGSFDTDTWTSTNSNGQTRGLNIHQMIARA